MALDTNLPLSGPNGSTAITDTTGNYSWAAIGNAQIQSNALLLDGAGDYIQAAINDGLLIGDKDFRLSFDFKVASADLKSTANIIVDQLDTSTVAPNYWSWQIYLQTSGQMVFNVYRNGSNPTLLAGPGTHADNLWHTCVIERTASVIRMSIDGVYGTGGSAGVADDRYYARLSSMYIGSRKGPNATNLYDLKGSIRNFSMEIFERIDPTAALTRTFVRIQPIGWTGKRFAQWIKAAQSGAAFPGIPVQVRSRGKMCITRGVPPWWGRPDSTTQLPTYKIRGRVMQRDPDTGIDTPLSLVRVALFFRRLHTLVDIQRSDDDGYVQFDNLMPGPQGYYAVAFDPEGAPLQNAVIYDRLSSEPGP